ncbi:MAG: alanine--tRNA ligase, partial [Muribaculaceae bacterium]|nr:alanine--tRNA ligase [Muribaculaceae bacterium]
IGTLFNGAPDLVCALRKALAENADLRRQAEEHMQQKIAAMAAELLAKAKVVNGITTVVVRGTMPADVVKGIAFAVRAASPEHTALIGATADTSGKPLLTVMLTDDVTRAGLNASAMVREAAKAIKGGGGGQPGFAQAGGKDADGISAAADLLLAALAK